MPLDVPDATQQKRRRRHRRIAIGALTFGLLIVAVVIPMVLPTRLDPVAAAHPAWSQDDGRRRQSRGTLTVASDGTPIVGGNRRDEELTIPSSHPDRGLDGLKGTLSHPSSSAAPRPGVLIIGGSGGHPRDPEMRGGLLVHHDAFKLYDALTELFVAHGMAVLRYDKRTCKSCYPDAKPDFAAFRFGWFDDDAEDALAALAAHPEVDAKALVVVGHSQGGAIAVRLAKRVPGVAAAVMLAGSTRPFREGLPGQLRTLAELRREQLDPLNAYILDRRAEDFEVCLNKAAATPQVSQPCLFGVSHQAFVDEATDAATADAAIASLPAPIFVAHGSLDRNIDPEIILGLRSRLRSRDAELHVIPDVGHTFVPRSRSDDPVLAPELVEALERFFASVPRPG